ncbi:DNA-binding LytR/AlgR family response regulator [Streptococcus gallinaceus]|uniref:LytR/AlgR family response regulator transcription factor n=1 Tax=Streptococcus gallinaceus TaxID=165758 RepID=UPI00209E5142|nr:LytTR family DNA-binding domain-containing protein [Streptococcus gallinaceus]MCP1639986.1 DNA-binding LytR/AlgR family response regulator [Streptococcus gallinaceus]MCP1770642.1 DNA-binding LytR/AlgR family response regulator [Streptococcus gallinaceus]
MTYRIALVDDHNQVTQELAGFCQHFATNEHLDIKTQQFNSAEVFLDFYQEFQSTNQAFDLIILDIEMGQLNGMEAARLIRAQDEKVVILFVTSLIQYAIQGYAVQALDFLLKPVDYASFAFRLQRAILEIDKVRRQKMNISIGKETLTIPTQTILFVEVQGHKLTYHTKKQIYETNGSMKSIENELIRAGFAKAGQSFLVNLAKIEAIRDNVIFIQDYRIPISRTRRQVFLQEFSHFIGGFQ